MAIKRLDPAARFRVICEYDSALINETPEELKALKNGVIGPDGEEESNPARYQLYLQDLDESKLKIKDDEKPSHFVFRCLTNQEMGQLQETHFEFDLKTKTQKFKGSKTDYFAELFRLGVDGMEDENGNVVKVGPNDVGLGVMIAIGSAISVYTQLGKHLKK